MLEENKSIRLSKAARDVNIGIKTAVDFLNKKGYSISADPNSKLTPEMYSVFLKEFASEKHVKEEAKKIGLQFTPHETIKIEEKKRASMDRENEMDELFIKNENFDFESKQIDTIKKNKETIPEHMLEGESSTSIEKPDSQIKIEGPTIIGKLDLDDFVKKPRKKKATNSISVDSIDSDSLELSLNSVLADFEKFSAKFITDIGSQFEIQIAEKTDEYKQQIQSEFDKIKSQSENQINENKRKLEKEAASALSELEIEKQRKLEKQKSEIEAEINRKKDEIQRRFDEIFAQEERKMESINVSATLEQKLIEHTCSNCSLSLEVFSRYIKVFKHKKAMIFQGAPGTGKSYLAGIFANIITNFQTSNIEWIQFHPSYSFEEFVEGLRFSSDKAMVIHDGILKTLCRKALEDPENNFVLIIDEINRGNMASIMGELMFLMENRGQSIKLLYSNDIFSIPSNLYFLGTMNTSDRSLALVDHALRRRFDFITLEPNFEAVYKYQEEKDEKQIKYFVSNLKEINAIIRNEPTLGSGYEIGHAYFMKTRPLNIENLNDIWDFEIMPLLTEYYFDNIPRIAELKTIFFRNIQSK